MPTMTTNISNPGNAEEWIKVGDSPNGDVAHVSVYEARSDGWELVETDVRVTGTEVQIRVRDAGNLRVLVTVP